MHTVVCILATSSWHSTTRVASTHIGHSAVSAARALSPNPMGKFGVKKFPTLQHLMANATTSYGYILGVGVRHWHYIHSMGELLSVELEKVSWTSLSLKNQPRRLANK